VATRLLPDVEALVVAWLKAHPSVSALVGTRVATELPAAPAWPFLTVTQIGGNELIADHLDDQYLQLMSWGDSKGQANLLIRTARAALIELRGENTSRGVVTDVRTTFTPFWQPDDSVSPPRPRYRCDFSLVCHPQPL
jgi:hypothetical protein